MQRIGWIFSFCGPVQSLITEPTAQKILGIHTRSGQANFEHALSQTAAPFPSRPNRSHRYVMARASHVLCFYSYDSRGISTEAFSENGLHKDTKWPALCSAASRVLSIIYHCSFRLSLLRSRLLQAYCV